MREAAAFDPPLPPPGVVGESAIPPPSFIHTINFTQLVNQNYLLTQLVTARGIHTKKCCLAGPTGIVPGRIADSLNFLLGFFGFGFGFGFVCLWGDWTGREVKRKGEV